MREVVRGRFFGEVDDDDPSALMVWQGEAMWVYCAACEPGVLAQLPLKRG